MKMLIIENFIIIIIIIIIIVFDVLTSVWEGFWS